MIESEMIEFLNKVGDCCGKKRVVFESGPMSPYNEVGGMAICLVCGDFVQLTGGSLDEEEVETYREMSK